MTVFLEDGQRRGGGGNGCFFLKVEIITVHRLYYSVWRGWGRGAVNGRLSLNKVATIGLNVQSPPIWKVNEVISSLLLPLEGFGKGRKGRNTLRTCSVSFSELQCVAKLELIPPLADELG